MKTSNSRLSPRARRAQAGVTLVELMVAMTIGLFLLGAVGIIYVNTATTSRASTQESQMNEDATLALELLQQQIRLAGFSNIVAASGARNFSGIAVRGCVGGFTTNDQANFSDLACGGDDDDPDALAVRYEATTLNSQSANDSAGVARPDNCSHNGITPWTAGATEGGAVSMSLADNRYYIADDNGVPSLFCVGRDGNGGAGFSAAAALIPNIEDMKIRYAITNAPVNDEALPHQVTAYVKADDPALGATAANWNRVAAVRVCLLARSAQPVPTGSNSSNDLGNYKSCDDADGDGLLDEVTNTDRYLRRAYVTTIQLRNMRPGLPQAYSAGENPYAYLNEEAN